MRILYFAWLRTRTGCSLEDVNPPADVTDVKSLLEWLKKRSPGHAAALADPSVVRAAVNQEHVRYDHPIKPGDEVALFPPVTGG